MSDSERDHGGPEEGSDKVSARRDASEPKHRESGEAKKDAEELPVGEVDALACAKNDEAPGDSARSDASEPKLHESGEAKKDAEERPVGEVDALACAKNDEAPGDAKDADGAEPKPEKLVPKPDDSSKIDTLAVVEDFLPRPRAGDDVCAKSRSRNRSRRRSRSRSRSRSRRKGKGGKGKGSGKSADKILNHSQRNLKDEDVSKIVDANPGEDLPFEEVNFSRNGLGFEGIQKVTKICRRCPKLRILKLFNNNIDDKGAEELSSIFRHCHGIEEIHLSHNSFTRVGVEAMLKAADTELPMECSQPLWLRTEHNDLQDPEEFARDMEKKFSSVCGREDRRKCMPRVCAHGCRIHLPFLIERSKGVGKGRDFDRRGGPERRRTPPRGRYGGPPGGRGYEARDRRHDRYDRYDRGRGRDYHRSYDRSNHRRDDSWQSYSRSRTPPRRPARNGSWRDDDRNRGRPPARLTPPAPPPKVDLRESRDEGRKLPAVGVKKRPPPGPAPRAPSCEYYEYEYYDEYEDEEGPPPQQAKGPPPQQAKGAGRRR